MRTPTKKLIKEADKLFSELVRRKGMCEKCGSVKNLQCAHVISRTNKHLRWNRDNALCLCLRCHLYWAHRSPLEFTEWFKLHFPIQYGFLMWEMNKPEYALVTSMEFTVERLKDELKSV